MKRLIIEVTNRYSGPGAAWTPHSILNLNDPDQLFEVTHDDIKSWKFWRFQIREVSGVDEMGDRNLLKIETDVAVDAETIESLTVKVVEHFPGLSFKERVLLMHLLYGCFQLGQERAKKEKGGGAGG